MHFIADLLTRLRMPSYSHGTFVITGVIEMLRNVWRNTHIIPTITMAALTNRLFLILPFTIKAQDMHCITAHREEHSLTHILT